MSKYFVDAFSEAGKSVDNEDSIGFKQFDDSFIVLAIADGIGGEDGGEIASRIAVDTVIEHVNTNRDNLRKLFDIVHKSIKKHAELNYELSRMGTTLTVAVVDGGNVRVGHVGDTRLYHIACREVISRTKDQTEVQKLIDLGVLTELRAKRYHRRNVLLSAITSFSNFDFQEASFSIEPRDKILLLSDGAYNLIDEKEIEELSYDSRNVETFTNKLKKTIEDREIKDDYSVVVLQVE